MRNNNNINCICSSAAICSCNLNNIESLNYPYYIYPGAPFHGFALEPNIIKNFNEELKLLKYELDTMKENDKKILFHLCIGSPSEEYQIGTNDEQLLYMHQIIPDHLYTIARTGVKVVNIIVSPDDLTSPLFKTQTEDFDMIDNKTYKHKILPIIIKIFRTMMPTNDKNRNNIFMERAKERNYTEVLGYDTKCFKQTDRDRDFVSSFYNTLKNVIERNCYNGGINTCFSFAVFNDDTPNASFNNFTMFKEIINYYNNDIILNTNNIILEWRYVKNNFCVSDVNGYEIFYVPFEKIVYDNNNKNNNRFIMYCKEKDEDNLILKYVNYKELFIF